MSAEQDNVRSLAAARKAKEQTTRRAAAVPATEASIRAQVWVLFLAVACAYLAYAYFAGAGH